MLSLLTTMTVSQMKMHLVRCCCCCLDHWGMTTSLFYHSSHMTSYSLNQSLFPKFLLQFITILFFTPSIHPHSLLYSFNPYSFSSLLLQSILILFSTPSIHPQSLRYSFNPSSFSSPF